MRKRILFLEVFMIQVAKIINTHGLKGECKLYLYTDDPGHRFEKGRILYLNEKTPLKVVRFRMQKGLGYAFLKGSIRSMKRKSSKETACISVWKICLKQKKTNITIMS